jgi:hypothetical protein
MININNKINIYFIKNYLFSFLIFLKYNKGKLGIGDWGLGIGDWGLGPIPNPQSPIPNFPFIIIKNYLKK